MTLPLASFGHVGAGGDDVVGIVGRGVGVELGRVLLGHRGREGEDERSGDVAGDRLGQLEDDRVLVGGGDPGDRPAVGLGGADDGPVVGAGVGIGHVGVEAALDRVGDVGRGHLAVDRRAVVDAGRMSFQHDLRGKHVHP